MYDWAESSLTAHPARVRVPRLTFPGKNRFTFGERAGSLFRSGDCAFATSGGRVDPVEMRYDFARAAIARHPAKSVVDAHFREAAVAHEHAEAVRGNAAHHAGALAGGEGIGVAHLAVGELYGFRAVVAESPVFAVAGDDKAVGCPGFWRRCCRSGAEIV